MARKYGLWGAIAGIFLLAALGVRSAHNWLSGSTPDNGEPTATADGEFITRDPDTLQTNARFGDQSETRPTETVTFSPIEQAGTYIQRQKSAERDAVVAGTNVEVIALAEDAPVPEQENNPPTQSAPNTTPSGEAAAQPQQPTPTAPQAVNARW